MPENAFEAIEINWQASWVVVVWQSMDGSGEILLAILYIFSTMPRQGVAELCRVMQALPMAMPYQQIVAQWHSE